MSNRPVQVQTVIEADTLELKEVEIFQWLQLACKKNMQTCGVKFNINNTSAWLIAN